VTFITWRTIDSVPYEKIRCWRDEKLKWLSNHGITAGTNSLPDPLTQLPSAFRSEFHRRFSNQWQDELDREKGRCIPRNRKASQIVGNALLHCDGDRYELDRFAIIPNHVHRLVSVESSEGILKQCRSWKQFTGRALDKRCGKTGRFWRHDSFDHLVRSQEQMEWLRRCIKENPVKAGVTNEESLYRKASGI